MKRWFVLLMAIILAVAATCAWAQSPAAGPNVNMVSGTDWTTGDPFLQRQNEPSVAVSTRNTSHLLAGANDYRSVDFEELFPDVNGEQTPDAWLGVFKSFDGGATWQSTLLPGFPADSSTAGRSSPLFGLQAAADPIVRAGTNGMFYYAGIGFNRTNNLGKVFVARFIDNNNKENGDPTNLQTPGLFTAVSPTDPIRYLGTNVVQSGTSTQFLDKPWLAVDVPRGSATCAISYTNPDGTTGVQTIPASNIYLTFSDFVNNNTQSAILFTRSTNCGATWSAPIALSPLAVNQGSVIAVAPPIPGTESLLLPIVYVAWRQFGSGKTPGAIMMAESLNGGASFTPAFAAHTFPLSCNTAPTGAGCPFDQGITGTSFRTNTYPAMAADTTGRVYLAWTQRQANGDARIMMQVGLVGIPLPPPAVVDNGPVRDDNGNPLSNLSGRGHQVMPSLAFNAGKLMLIYYDLRQDHTIGQFTPQANKTSYSETRLFEGELTAGDPADSAVFNFYVDDAGALPTHPLTTRRHTIDVQAAQATPGAPLNLAVPAFTAFRVAHYQFGINPFDNPYFAEQLEVNPPNLPMFQQGHAPFMGDYIDVAGAPTFVLKSGKWHFNTDSSAGLPVFQAVWTDNRNVRPPLNGDWTQYTPPYSASNPQGGGVTSKFDPTKTVLNCNTNFVASRNQDVYTARIAPGLVVAAPGNQKSLGNALGTSTLLQRSFSVVVQNTTNVLKTFRLTIANQPLLANGSVDPKGQATFRQLPPTPTVTTVDVQVNPLSSISRAVFVKSQNPTASVTVNVQEITQPGGTVVSAGLTGTTVINPDPTTPPVINPDNPSVGNPSIGNAEVYNPSVGNPSVGNPSVGNTALLNPSIGNPSVGNPSVGNPSVGNPSVGNPSVGNQAFATALNPSVGNPSIGNPSVGNPSIGNPSIGNQSVTDASYSLTNTGNTTATYSVKLFGPTLPTSLLYQLILNKVYYLNQVGPDGCTLQVQPTNVILSNIPNPTIETVASTLGNPSVGNPSVGNATVAVPPGETVQVTLRISPGGGQPPLTPDQVQQEVLNNVTPVVVSHAVNTQNLGQTNPQPPISLTITTKTLPNANTNVAYSQQVAAIGGVINPPTTNYTWTLFSGNLPPGLSLTTSGPNTQPQFGLISGTPTAAGTYNFVVQVADAATPTAHIAQQALSILAIAPLTITTTTLSPGDQGAAYSQTIAATGGTGTLSFTPVTVDGVSLNGSGQFSGTPTLPGTFPFTATVTDALNVSASQSLTLTVNAAPTITTTSLPTAADQGHLYTQTIAATGGTGTLSFTPVSVDGVSLSSSGQFSGTPTSTGTFPFTATVTDALNVSASQSLTLTVNAAPTITTTSLPTAADQGHPYTQTIAATGGTGTLSFTPVTVDGVSLSSSGQFSGTPTSTGTFPFTATVSDTLNVSASQSLTLTVNAAPTITTTSLPPGIQGIGYSQPISATGGTGTLSFTPLTVDGVTLGSSGTFAGIPTSTGSFQFTATVTDALNVSATQQLTLVVNSSLSLLPATLAGGDQGVVYQQQQLVATGGTPPYGNWNWTPAPSSSLPPGLSLAPSAGTITGTPTASGTYSFIVSVSDSVNTTASQTYAITVNLPPTITGATLPTATVGDSSYSYTIPVSDGTSPFAWSATGLPAGLTIANGLISGPATGGSFAPPYYDVANWTATASNGGTTSITPNCLATVTVTDAVGGSDSANFLVGSTPSSSCATFGYAINLGGGGVSPRTWSFQANAATTGTLTFNWHYTGFHAFFNVTALLQVFSGADVITLYDPPQQDCCTSPSGGFDVQGTGTIAVTADMPFGFTVGGHNFDSNAVLNGTLYITNFAIQ